MSPTTPPRSPSRKSTPERRAATRREFVANIARSPSRLLEQIHEANARKNRLRRSAMSPGSKQRAINAINKNITKVRENLIRSVQQLERAENLAYSVLKSARMSRNMLRGVGNAAALAEAQTNLNRAQLSATTATAELNRLAYLLKHPRAAGSIGKRQLAAASRA